MVKARSNKHHAFLDSKENPFSPKSMFRVTRDFPASYVPHNSFTYTYNVTSMIQVSSTEKFIDFNTRIHVCFILALGPNNKIREHICVRYSLIVLNDPI